MDYKQIEPLGSVYVLISTDELISRLCDLVNPLMNFSIVWLEGGQCMQTNYQVSRHVYHKVPWKTVYTVSGFTNLAGFAELSSFLYYFLGLVELYYCH